MNDASVFVLDLASGATRQQFPGIPTPRGIAITAEGGLISATARSRSLPAQEAVHARSSPSALDIRVEVDLAQGIAVLAPDMLEGEGPDLATPDLFVPLCPGYRVMAAALPLAPCEQFQLADVTGDAMPDVVTLASNAIVVWPGSVGGGFDQPTNAAL